MFQKLILVNGLRCWGPEINNIVLWHTHYQLGKRSLNKRPLSWHKALVSESLWLAHLERPVRWRTRNGSTRHSKSVSISNVNALAFKKFSHSYSCRCKYTMLWYSWRMHLAYNAWSLLCMHSLWWYKCFMDYSFKWVRKYCVLILFSFQDSKSSLWKDLIKGHTVTTFHLASDGMPSASFRNQSLWKVETGSLLETWQCMTVICSKPVSTRQLFLKTLIDDGCCHWDAVHTLFITLDTGQTKGKLMLFKYRIWLHPNAKVSL